MSNLCQNIQYANIEYSMNFVSLYQLMICAMDGYRRYKSVRLRQERDEALFREYCKALNQHDFLKPDDVYDYVRKRPAPRFYVEAEFLRDYISCRMRGKSFGRFGEETQRKFDELYQRYLFYSNNSNLDRKSLLEISEMIVNTPAPEYYISRRTTRMIIARQKKLKWDSVSKRHTR